MQSGKQKGRRLQQEVCLDILSSFPCLGVGDVRSTSMGANGEDVLLSPLGARVFPYSVECKNCERLNIWRALEQCGGHGERTPLVVFKKNREEAHVALPWKSFLSLCRGDEVVDGGDALLSELDALVAKYRV